MDKTSHTKHVFFVMIFVVTVIFLTWSAWTPLSEYENGQEEVTSDKDTPNQIRDFETSTVYVGQAAPLGALSAKITKELELNNLAKNQETNISAKNIYDKLIERGASIDKDLAERMKANNATPDDWQEISMLIADALSTEENYRVELSQYSNFQELKRVCDERARTTGLQCGNDLLAQEAAYKDASATDILEILNTGAVLPEDAAFLMMKSNNIALISELQKAGHAIDINYVDKYQSQNMLEAYVANYSIYDDGKAIVTIDQLLQLGVPLSVNDGTRDPLDYVFTNITADNAASRFAVARKLLNSGLTLTASHNELLNKLRVDNPEIYKDFVK